MDDIKELKQFAKLKRTLPPVLYLGEVSSEWVDDIVTTYDKEEWTERPIKPTDVRLNLKNEFNGYKETGLVFGNDYRQMWGDIHFPTIDENPLFNLFEDMEHVRWSYLSAGKMLPAHLDSPWTYRFIVMVEGSQRFDFPNNKEYKSAKMSKGDVWFVNPGYKHSVENLLSSRRLSILGNFAITTRTTDELLRIKSRG